MSNQINTDWVGRINCSKYSDGEGLLDVYSVQCACNEIQVIGSKFIRAESKFNILTFFNRPAIVIKEE